MTDDETGKASELAGRSRAIGGALSGVAASVVAAGLALTSKLTLGTSNIHWSFSVGLGALTALFLALLLMHPKYRGRAGAVACVATLGWLPFESLAFTFDNEPVVTNGDSFRCGTGTMGLVAIAPFVAVGMLLVGLIVAVGTRQASLDAARRWTAVCSLVVVGLATGVGIARIGRPKADTYAASLPVIGRLSPGQSFTLDERSTVHYSEGGAARHVSSDSPARVCTLEGVGGVTFNAPSSAPGCPLMILKHDRGVGLWIVEANRLTFAFKDDTKVAHDVYPAEIARALGPPVEWTLGGLFGFGFGVFAFLLGARATEREASLEGIDGTLQSNGWVTHPWGPPVLLHATTGLSTGPVFLQLEAAARATYRETGAGALVAWRPGTLHELREELRARAAALYALALTSALLCAAPLLLSGLGGAR